MYFRDVARTDAAGLMRDLRRLGIDRVVMLTAPNAVGLGGGLITMNPAAAAPLSSGSAVAAATNDLRPMLPGARKKARGRPASA